jgi:RNA polymerase sigma factor (sigma-70 family)
LPDQQARTESTQVTTDAELVRRALEDPSTFAAVFDRYHRDIYLYCLRRLGSPEDADDAAGTVFLKAYAALDRFRPGRNGAGMTFRSWIFSIAHNVVVDAWRKPNRTVSLDTERGGEMANRLPASDFSPEHLAIRSEEARTVLTLLSNLPEQHRAVVELRLAGLSVKEVAAALGISVAAAKSNQYRGYQRLRDLLEASPEHAPAEELVG